MGVLKRVFGWLFLFIGGNCLVSGFVIPDGCGREAAIGHVVGGLLFAAIFFYFGAKWIKKEVENK